MDTIVTTYLIYVALSLVITIWVARALFKNGLIFLIDVFGGNVELANSVNHLLVVGFYLINLGFVALALRIASPVPDARASIEALASKIGTVLLVLGAMHFFNLYVFSRLRRNARLVIAPPPVEPDACTRVGASAAHA
jgi:hypothetical protein